MKIQKYLITVVVLLLSSLGGCGQTGALYLPDPKKPNGEASLGTVITKVDGLLY